MTLRIGVVGAGARAGLANRALVHDAVIVGVADPHPHAQRRARRHFGDVPVVPDHRALIELGLDAAFVVSPDDTHATITSDLLRSGVATYLEKPIATRISDADSVLNTAYKSGTKLYVGHNMRHMHVVRQLHQLIDAGLVGDVKAIWCRHFVGHGGDYYFRDWHAERKRATGLLLQKGAHDIDVMHWLAGSVTREVTAMGDLMVYGANPDRRDNSSELLGEWFDPSGYPATTLTGLNPVIDVEDLSMMLMRLDSGVLASYQQCHFTPDYWRNYTVIGTHGRLENFGDSEGGVIKLWRRRGAFLSADEEFPIRGDAAGHSDADDLTVAEFVRFVREGGPTDTNPLGARDAVAAGVAATVSLRTGSTPQRVPRVEPHIAEYFRTHQGVKAAAVHT